MPLTLLSNIYVSDIENIAMNKDLIINAAKKYINYMLNTPGQELYIKNLDIWLKNKCFMDIIPEVKVSRNIQDQSL